MPDGDEQQHRALIGAVNAILAQHDPLNLIGPNEYDPEADAILARINDAADAGELRSIVYRVFQDYFGVDGCGPEEQYEQIAQQIWDVWQRTAAAATSETAAINEDSAAVCSQEADDQPHPHEVTRLLGKWRGGSEDALNEVFTMVYGELHNLARGRMWRERRGHTLDPAGLINELYLKMRKQRPVDCPNRAFFFGMAARQMRQILIEYARKRKAAMRPPPSRRVSFTKAYDLAAEHGRDVSALADALNELEEFDPRLCELVDLYYFVGLSQEQIAETIGIPVRKVVAELKAAKAWLSDYLRSSRDDA